MADLLEHRRSVENAKYSLTWSTANNADVNLNIAADTGDDVLRGMHLDRFGRVLKPYFERFSVVVLPQMEWLSPRVF